MSCVSLNYSDYKDPSDKKHRDKEKMKHKDGSTDKYKDKHKEKRKEDKVNYYAKLFVGEHQLWLFWAHNYDFCITLLNQALHGPRTI